MLSKIDHLLDSRKSPNVPKIDITYNTIKLFKFSKSKHTYMWMDAYWEYFLIFKFYFIYFFIQQVFISYLFYTYCCIHVNPNSSHHYPRRHFPPLVSIHLFSTSVSLFLPWKPVHLYHFSRFHIHALIYYICFSLSDLLYSVWQSLDSSTSLQMTQFRSFLWLSNIPLYICATLLYPFICRWAFRLLPWPGYCK